MRILIFSDTHGRTDGMDRALSAISGVDAVLHAGDVSRDIGYLQDVYELPIYGVRGNNDFIDEFPLLQTVELGGHRILLTHGHTLRVKQSYDRLIEEAVQQSADIAVFGHTHVSFCGYERGVLLLNPGTMMYAGVDRNTFGIIETDGGKIGADILKESSFLSPTME